MIIECGTRAVRLYTTYPLWLSLIAAVGLPLNALSYLIASQTYSFLLWPVITLLSVVLFAAQIHASNDAISGNAPSFSRTYRWLFGRVGPVFEVAARYIGAGFLLLFTIIGIPFGVRLFVRWFFAEYEVVIANAQPDAAISESCVLVRGRWWATAGRLIAPYLAIAVPSIAVSFFIPVLGRFIWSTVAALLITPLFAAYFTTLYLGYKRTSPSTPEPSMVT